jgi:hypothetical protein
MRRGAWCCILVLLILSAGCNSSNSSFSRYPSPLYATEPWPPPPPPPRQVVPPPVVTPPPPPRAVGPAPGWMPAQGISKRWTDIVIHHSGSASGGARAFDNYHRSVRHWDELGYHFVIGNGTDTPDGTIEVGSRWTKQKYGAHCKTPDNYFNEHGIGICLVGDFDRTRPTPAQLASLDRLLRFLVDQTGIPASHINGHGGVTGKTACPGRNFPLSTVKRELTQRR